MRPPAPRSLYASAGCLLAGHLFLGLAHVALLPPWEGFDETAHYSYLQQLADGQLPRLGSARISRDVDGYARVAPLPYASSPPMEHNAGLTYKAFFEARGGARAAAEAFVHGPPEAVRRYAPGPTGNWQAQHPPLYYLALSPVYRATRHLSWASHLFWLRLVSYCLGWLALVIGVYSCVAGTTEPVSDAEPRWAVLGLALWPVAMPGWFPEMARLGNDSLAALIVAGIWVVVTRAVRTGVSVPASLVLGALLGAGCLTKAFFIPIAAGVVGFLWVRRRTREVPTPTAARLALTILVAAGVAGWWYARNVWEFGVASGSSELIELERAGGLLRGLTDRFTLWAWLRGHAASVATVAWSGTWSLARPPYVFLVPLVLLVLAAGGAYLVASARLRTATAALPAWLLVPMALAVSYHVLVRIALTGEGTGSPGYYVHVLAPALGVAFGLGTGAWWASRAFRAMTAALVGYAVLFGAVVSGAQVLLFGGWLFKAGDSKFYQAPAALPTLFGLPDALDRLQALAYPTLGAAAWLGGGACVLLGLVLAWNATRVPARQ